MTNNNFEINYFSFKRSLRLKVALIILMICVFPIYVSSAEFYMNGWEVDNVLPIQVRTSVDGISVNLPDPTPLSPEAAAVVQYTNYPVDYCSGMPQIDIPLYEVKSGDITIPLTLSYRSSGLKPGEGSGWVGTGWVLNAEPGLVRTVNGLPDETPDYGYLNTTPLGNGNFTQEDMEKVDKGWAEYEPDKFYYKLLSQSGSFYCQRYWERADRFVTYPDDQLVIDGPAYSVFNIRDANGFLYNFGGNGNYEYSGKEQAINYRTYVTRWMCNYIQSAKGSSAVYFSYEDMIECTPLFLNGYYILEDSITGTIGEYEKPILTTPSGKYYVQVDGSLTNYEPVRPSRQYIPGEIGYIVKRKALSTIRFDGGSARFVNDGKDLKYFEVLDTEGKIVRRVDFYINSYNSSTVLTKLDSLRISAPGCSDRVYRFDYNEANKVPDTGAYSCVDYYGYYNGSKGDSIVPYVELESQYYNIKRMEKIKHNAGGPKGERDPKSEYARCGMLTKITSPEGVITEFEYEPNLGGSIIFIGSGPEYKEDFHEGGGMRIHCIRKIANGVQREFRFYIYKQDPVFSGKPSFGCAGPGYSCCGTYLPYGQFYVYEKQSMFTNTLGSSRYSRIRIINSSPVSNIFHPNGMAIFYNHVEEEIYDDAGHKEVNEFHYTLPPHLWIGNSPWYDRRLSAIPFDGSDSDSFLYYKLFKTRKLMDGKLVECKEYEYAKKEGENAGVVSITRPFPYFTKTDSYGNVSSYYSPGAYYLERGCNRLIKETAIRYDDNGKEFRITKDYDYDGEKSSGSMTGTRHLSPVRIITTGSSGGTMMEEFLYPEDFDERINLNQDLLTSTNRYGIPLEYRVTENGKTQIIRQKFREEVFTRKGEYADFESVSTCGYDSYGQLSYTCVEGELPTRYIWGYNHQYVIAKIEKCDEKALLAALNLTLIELGSYANGDKPSEKFLQNINSLREKLPDSQIYTYTYEPLVGMTSMTTPNGMTIHYENDGFGRLLESYYYEDGKKTILEKHDYNTPNNKK